MKLSCIKWKTPAHLSEPLAFPVSPSVGVITLRWWQYCGVLLECLDCRPLYPALHTIRLQVWPKKRIWASVLHCFTGGAWYTVVCFLGVTEFFNQSKRITFFKLHFVTFGLLAVTTLNVSCKRTRFCLFFGSTSLCGWILFEALVFPVKK